MGKPVGFDELKIKIDKFVNLTASLNIRPWSIKEMYSVGYGIELPNLLEFKNIEEINEWWINKKIMEHEIMLIQENGILDKI